MKKVVNRTPRNVKIDFSSIPQYQQDAMCRVVINAVNRMFESPSVKSEYERWLKERKQKEVQGGNK